jgi:hypothetical protein
MREPLSDQAGTPPTSTFVDSSPPPTQALGAGCLVAVAVISAGLTGLSTALHLAEAGIDVAVLEAKEIGLGRIAARIRSGRPVPKAGTRGHPAP